MEQHPHSHGHRDHHPEGGPDHDEAGLADLLDMDAEVLGHLDDLTAWAAQHAPDSPRTLVDVGAGTGTGSLALLRRFATAEVVAVDLSTLMLDRLRAAALEQGLGERVRLVQADLDAAWPEIGDVDVVWAASSLHHLADPDRLLRDVAAALHPGGLMVVVEIDELASFLPDDLGTGRSGLEIRRQEAMVQAGFNDHPDWAPHLERAGLEVTGQRVFAREVSPEPSVAGPYAHAYLRLVRPALDGLLAPEDLDALDRLLADDGPDALVRRADLTIRVSHVAWAARRRA